MGFDNDLNSRFSFAVYDYNDIDEEDKEKEYQEAIKETKEMVEGAPDEVFPDFLWDPMVNEFDVDDGYIAMGLCDRFISIDQEIIDALSMTTKINDYYQYEEAMEKYEAYYNFIINTFGSFEVFANVRKEGMTFIPLIPMPTLKKKSKLRKLAKLNIPISKIDDEEIFSLDIIQDIINDAEEQIDVYIDEYEYNTLYAKTNKSIQEALAKENRIQNIYVTSSIKTNPAVSGIMQFIAETSNTNYNGMKTTKTLNEALEELHADDYLTEEEKQQQIASLTTFNTNWYLDGLTKAFMSGEERQREEIYETLFENGWNISGMIKNSSMTKQAKRAILSRFDHDGIASGKKLKKMKKKQEKQAKKLNQRLMADQTIRNELVNNRISYVNDNGELDFTMDDLYGGD